MSATDRRYEEYLAALVSLRNAPIEHAEELQRIATTYNRALRLADASVEGASARFGAGTEAVHRHLRNAASFVDRAGHPNRIPPRIKPSVVPQTATESDVDRAIAALGEATVALGRLVDVPVVPPPTADPRAPVAYEEPAPVRKPRRSRTAPLLAAVTVVVVLLVVVLVVVLLPR